MGMKPLGGGCWALAGTSSGVAPLSPQNCRWIPTKSHETLLSGPLSRDWRYYFSDTALNRDFPPLGNLGCETPP